MLDQIDIRIIEMLVHDAKRSHDSIGEELELSRSTVHRRINRLQSCGVIQRFSLEIDWQRLGFTLDVFILVVVNTKDFRRLQLELISTKSDGIIIEECYRVTSKYGFMMRVKAKSLHNLTDLYDKLLLIEDVQETNTMFILDEKHIDIEIPSITQE